MDFAEGDGTQMSDFAAFSARFRATFFLLVLLSYSATLADPAMAARKSRQMPSSSADPEAANRVRTEFLHAWNAYKKYAWGHDELRPLSKTYRDWYGVPLLMTPVDALDTMLIMGLKPQADEARELIAGKLSFDHDIYVKNFEITIRLLGGLLSSYEMTGDKRLLRLADDLGTRLLPAFESPTGMPYVEVNLKTGKVRKPETNPAEAGTLLVEFGTLSRLTGKPVYYEKAKRALVAVYERRSAIGLVGSSINVETGKWMDPTSHISGGIDSYYEYLLKCWLLFGDEDCHRMWENSVRAVNKYLAEETATGFWYGQADMNTGEMTGHDFGALDAFFPAVLALSGDIEHARRLQDSAFKMWTTYGIEPEEIDYRSMKIIVDGYALRPEIVESAYYLHHFTGDPKYVQMGQTFLTSLMKYCRTEAGYASLTSVEKKTQRDEMESYFLAETLKYLYLLLSPPQKFKFENYVFNTEAHPMLRKR